MDSPIMIRFGHCADFSRSHSLSGHWRRCVQDWVEGHQQSAYWFSPGPNGARMAPIREKASTYKRGSLRLILTRGNKFFCGVLFLSAAGSLQSLYYLKKSSRRTSNDEMDNGIRQICKYL